MSLKSIFIAAALQILAGTALAGEAQIVVIDSYARASTASAKSAAIFLELKNHGAADRLLAASSEVANRVELHTHEEDANGVMRMIHVEDGLAVPAGGSLMLERGGQHLMLMGLTRPLEQGDSVSLTLSFEKAGDLVVEVPVDLQRKSGGGHAGHTGNGDAHGQGHSDG